MDSYKGTLKHIWNRTRAENKLISLGNLLKAYDMEMYLMSCGDRIASAELIDGEHIQMNFLNMPDLLFDSRGLAKCWDILCGYVNEEELDKIYDIAESNDSITREDNRLLDTLRSASIKSLFVLGFSAKRLWRKEKKPEDTYPDEYIDIVSKMNRAELFSRTPFNKVRIRIMEKAINLYISIRYWNIFSILKKCTKDTAQ